MNNYYSMMQLLFPILISLHLCLNPVITHGATEETVDEQASEEFENSLMTNERNDYRNGFVELLNFIDSLNNTLIALNSKLAAQDTTFATLNKKIDAQKVELLNTLNARLSTHDVQFTTQIAKVSHLSQQTNLLRTTAYPNLNTWEGFDRLIRNQGKQIKTGKSFNGSTLSNIKSRVSQIGKRRSYSVIVFVNHLDEAIDDFTIYDKYNTTYNPAPSSIARRTQEVFTFAHPSWYPEISFSYAIPILDIQIAAICYPNGRSYGAGLAFVHKVTDIKTYYDSKKGIEGSSVHECCGNADRNLSVGYKNLYARMFAGNEGDLKATLRIELFKVPLDD